jgi:hypothetical protein
MIENIEIKINSKPMMFFKNIIGFEFIVLLVNFVCFCPQTKIG